MTRNDWNHAYPYEPGQSGEPASIRFSLTTTLSRSRPQWVTFRTVAALQSWIESNRNRIISYTIVTPGAMSSAALVRITDDLLAGIEHVYTQDAAQRAVRRNWEKRMESGRGELAALLSEDIIVDTGRIPAWESVIEAIRQWEAEEDEAAEQELAGIVQVGRFLEVWRNQGLREAVVVAVQDDGPECIIEYMMPSYVTYSIRMDRIEVGRVLCGKNREPRTLEDHGRSFGSRVPAWAREQMASPERERLIRF